MRNYLDGLSTLVMVGDGFRNALTRENAHRRRSEQV
jgi:hypothetical protein